VRIAFDAKRIYNNSTGLGNYGRLLVSALADFYPENEYRLYSPQIKLNVPFKERVKQVSPQLKNKIASAWWRTFSVAKELKKSKIDLYHGLTNELPVGIEKSGVSSIVTIHDLLFLKYPQWYPFIDRKIYAAKFKSACKRSAHIIATSNVVKEDIINCFSVSPGKISVVYQACDNSFSEIVNANDTDNFKNKFGLNNQPYYLYISAFSERKNHIQLLEAFKNVSAKSVTLLVLAGKSGPTLKLYCKKKLFLSMMRKPMN
jgi:glycosyltransferase involved in cell wall biosynthesis